MEQRRDPAPGWAASRARRLAARTCDLVAEHKRAQESWPAGWRFVALRLEPFWRVEDTGGGPPLLHCANSRTGVAMSRAFVKESDRDDETLPDREISAHPNFVTARGLTQLEDRVRDLEQERSDARACDDSGALARAARELRYFQARRDSARLVEPAASPSCGVVMR